MDEQGVRFLWRDYRDNQQKAMTLEGVEFLRRFCLHILDKGFVRIRHYGFLSTSNRPVLRALQQRLGLSPVIQRVKKDWKDICRQHLGFDPDLCPVCGKAAMVTIERFLPGRGPPCEYPESSVYNKTSTLQ